ncbi:hypothetical protein PPACK8108_LOCUS21821 [Phakopsora pachyrhizi]|uniref:Uncharacterized protein n=1 Tax=Phakopsora pachyrhizi TaxID=170000 RepID=A0AAV0BKX7_PHAPC|nr:hypothetical protein PPACK8108_LOCUS21821 [Phakopsora pachyrhizi]
MPRTTVKTVRDLGDCLQPPREEEEGRGGEQMRKREGRGIGRAGGAGHMQPCSPPAFPLEQQELICLQVHCNNTEGGL